MRILFCVYLLPGALWDIKTKHLPGIYIWLGCILMGGYALWQVLSKKRLLSELFISLFLGVLCYFFARYSHCMGEGDAWIILIMGLALPFYEFIKIWMLSFFLSAMGAIFSLICERRIINKKIPYVPFIFLAAAIVLVR